MKTRRDIASFVLRFTQELWRDAQGEPRVQWRGHIRHVQGDEEARFTEFADAVAFIQRYLTQLTQDSIDALPGESDVDEEKVLRESFRLWEEFAAGYTNAVFEAMDRTIKQSETFRQQMDDSVQRALQSWQLPTQADQAQTDVEQIVQALNDLQAQVKVLTAKVSELEKAVEERG